MGIRQPFNSISHMVGAGCALLLLPIMILDAENPIAITAALVYGASLIAMYTLSVLFHSISHQRAQAWLFRLDQVGIYLLIAGTYTPVALLLIGGTPGWLLLAIEWSLAATGIIILLTVHRTPQHLHQIAYIALGWAAVIVLPDLLKIPVPALMLLLGGGVLYTGGSYLYNRDRPRTLGPFGDHELWHMLVLMGSLLHAVFILQYVL